MKPTHSVSVVVPVYNVAKYIERCARSIFEQTLKDLEIIFIDDCSPDDSVNIIRNVLQEYPERQPDTIILRTSKNSGQAHVRGFGMREAHGDYLIQCDGDDWVDKDYYESLYKEAVRVDADMVVGDIVREYKDKTESTKIPSIDSYGKQIIKDFHKNVCGLNSVNKLIKSSVYKQWDIYPWDGLNMWEDNGLFARLLYYTGKVSQVRGPVYHYDRTNESAITAGYGIKQVEQMIQIARNLEDFFMSKSDAEEFRDTVDAFKYLARINLITDSYHNYKRFLKTFPESKRIAKTLDRNAFSAKGKIRFDMVRNGMAPLFILLFKFRNLLLR